MKPTKELKMTVKKAKTVKGAVSKLKRSEGKATKSAAKPKRK